MAVSPIDKRLQTFSPSQSVALTPLRGKLQAMFISKPAAGPPLSVEKTITELLYRPLALSALRTCKQLKRSAYRFSRD